MLLSICETTVKELAKWLAGREGEREGGIEGGREGGREGGLGRDREATEVITRGRSRPVSCVMEDMTKTWHSASKHTTSFGVSQLMCAPA